MIEFYNREQRALTRYKVTCSTLVFTCLVACQVWKHVTFNSIAIYLKQAVEEYQVSIKRPDNEQRARTCSSIFHT